MTWPLVLDLTGSLPHGSGDVWQNLWNFWWWKKALWDLQVSPYATDFLFFPHGVSLAFHTHSPFNQLAALPVNLLFGPVAAYNLATLSSLALSGLGAYLLARELVGNGRAAFLAGLVFAFFPHHLEQTLEHLNLASMQFLPLVCLFAIRVLRTGRTPGRRASRRLLRVERHELRPLRPLPGLRLARPLGRRAPARGPTSSPAPPGVPGLLAAAATAVVLMAPFIWPMHSRDPVERART